MSYQASPNYANATEGEKKWFDSYMASRDLLTATYAAFKVEGDDSARAYGRKVSQRPHVRALIDEFCRTQSLLPTVDDLKREYIDIARSPDASLRERLQALTAYERLCGFGRFSKAKSAEGTDSFDPLEDLTYDP